MSPRTEEQFAEIRSSRKEQIVKTALKLFAEHGYRNTPISSIAAEAEISKGLLYNYFDTKEELLNEVIRRGVTEMLMPTEEAGLRLVSRDDFRRYIETNFRELSDNQQYWKLYFSLMVQPDVSSKFASMVSEIATPWLHRLEDYYRLQGDRDPRTRAFLLGALMDGLGLQLVLNNSEPVVLGIKLEEIKDMIVEYFS